MIVNSTEDWRDSHVLFVNDGSCTFTDLFLDVDLDNLQFAKSHEALSSLSKAANSHAHYQLVFINADQLNVNVEALFKQIHVQPSFHCPTIVVLNESVPMPENESAFNDLVRDAFEQHRQQQNEFIKRLSTFNPKILAVEDDEINQKITKLMLDGFNCHYDLVDNGEQALGKTQDEHYDVVLLDIGLPDMDGFEVAKQIRAQERSEHLPLIAVTAFITAKSMNRCYEVGMDDVIVKPVMLPTLQYAIACNLVSRI